VEIPTSANFLENPRMLGIAVSCELEAGDGHVWPKHLHLDGELAQRPHNGGPAGIVLGQKSPHPTERLIHALEVSSQRIHPKERDEEVELGGAELAGATESFVDDPASVLPLGAVPQDLALEQDDRRAHSTQVPGPTDR
jgi:hypothetical protein